ncbi:hypothetical protein [Deinococcus frigens]|uniref:hypothetical protein n=1 Tax=Deinococcus frigens TaxID=249403 RepID=UPI000496C132|nr:hypothetical protein [Deinococcus frigens]
MNTSEQKDHHQYLTDAQGKKVAVLLPIEEYEQLLEDLYDGRAVRERRGEPTISLEEMKSRLGHSE